MGGWGNDTMVEMECDSCGEVWECKEEETESMVCPDCLAETVHRKVGSITLKRIWSLLGDRVVETERLVEAFAACTVGGVEFAEIVLKRAVERGLLVVGDGLVRRGGALVLEEWD